MTLHAQFHLGTERQILLKTRTMQLMATQAGDRFFGARVNDLGPHRMGHLMSLTVATTAQHRITLDEQLRVVAPVWNMTFGAGQALMSEPGRLVFLVVEMATHAQLFLVPQKEAFFIGSVRIVARQTGFIRVHIVMIGCLLKRLYASMAFQAHVLCPGSNGKTATGCQLPMTLATFIGRKRIMLVGPQQPRLVRGVGIVAGRAIGVGDGPAAMNFFEGRIRIVASETQGRHRPGQQTRNFRSMHGMAGHALRLSDRLVNNGSLGPGR